MAELVVLGAGLSGTLMAYELVPKLRKGQDRVTVIGQGSRYHFVPSNPWVAVGWREKQEIEVDLAPVMRRKGIGTLPQGARRVLPNENRIELEDGGSVAYDYLVIATGPELAFDEIEGLGPEHNTQSVCHVDHATQGKGGIRALVAKPGPVVIGAVQGASCFGPAYEFAFILDTALRDAQGARPRADDLRHVRALYRPSRPRRRRRHQGPARKRDARAPHQVDCERPGRQGRTRQDVVEEIAEER